MGGVETDIEADEIVDARRHLEHIVEPRIAAFEKCPYSHRRAFLACLVTFHIIEYIAPPRKPGNLREAFRKAR
jgi:hypothetical protein